VDGDDTVGIDFDVDAVELSLGPERNALSLAEEAVQLGDMVPEQREPGRARPLPVLRQSSSSATGPSQLARTSCLFGGSLKLGSALLGEHVIELCVHRDSGKAVGGAVCGPLIKTTIASGRGGFLKLITMRASPGPIGVYPRGPRTGRCCSRVDATSERHVPSMREFLRPARRKCCFHEPPAS